MTHFTLVTHFTPSPQATFPITSKYAPDLRDFLQLHLGQDLIVVNLDEKAFDKFVVVA